MNSILYQSVWLINLYQSVQLRKWRFDVSYNNGFLIMAAGRKLAFDKEAALEAAMHLFWQKGYVGASLADLTAAMGINKPSLYATFGNKEALFNLATQRYVEQKAEPNTAWLSRLDLTLRERIRSFILAAVAGQCQEGTPKGCYITASISESSNLDMPASTRELVNRINRHMENVLIALLESDEQALSKGLKPKAKAIALSVNTLLNGTAAMAKAGRTQQELEEVVDIFLDGAGIS